MAGDGELRRSTATSGGVRRQPATGREGETKYWDVNVDDFNLEQENELEVVNSRFEEPCIPSTSSIVEEEEIGENDDLGIDDD
ncbi:uncharacterized protein LOC126410573 isoform X2 [Nymphaea colorata]|uniref:uncharacterized protein LOC126410573 isoform X2 n=1 Tax=Nymphaea colorata TaxID=210225 RepID=UPI00162D2346|nr:uncharacterized protein LOC126410573 isoform X2 [Nymphaea colorata]